MEILCYQIFSYTHFILLHYDLFLMFNGFKLFVHYLVLIAPSYLTYQYTIIPFSNLLFLVLWKFQKDNSFVFESQCQSGFETEILDYLVLYFVNFEPSFKD